MLRALLLLALCVVSCARDDAVAHLVTLDRVEQRDAELSRITLHGRGFPVGARGEALLKGTLYPAGDAARTVELRAPCRASSDTSAQVDLQSAAASLPEGPFEGRLEVRFGSAESAFIVGARDYVVVRLGSAAGGLVERLGRRQRARSYQQRLGILALELSEQGVQVAQLDPAGLAARGGLRESDVLTRFAGVPVQLPEDVMAASAPLRIELKRRGEAHVRAIQLHVAHEGGASLPLLLVCGLLGLAAGALCAYARRPSRLRPRERWLVLACLGSLLVLLVWLLESVSPLVRESLYALLLSGPCGWLSVYLVRRARPTLRTTRDPALAPLL